MIYQSLDRSRQPALAELFTAVFSTSEGPQEGKLVGQLASTLAANIDNEEVLCFGACENNLLAGVIFFTRLRFSQAVRVYMLAPVAVSTAHQGKGIGQALIHYGLDELKQRGVNVVVTYGDPAFYARVGFEPLSESVIQAPLTLSMPGGWQGQSLTRDPIPALDERPACVEAFNNPVYW